MFALFYKDGGSDVVVVMVVVVFVVFVVDGLNGVVSVVFLIVGSAVRGFALCNAFFRD